MHAFTKLFVVLSAFETTITAKRDERGATVVEYALVIGLVSLVLVGGWAVLGTKITGMIGGINFTSGSATTTP